MPQDDPQSPTTTQPAQPQRRRTRAKGTGPKSTAYSLLPKDAGEYIGFTDAFLKADRARPQAKRRGPAFIRFGRSVRYRIGDLDAWLQRNRVETRDSRNPPEAA